ncbi:hypothetical protein F5Y10DRAFT_241227 [Nemania abortiva]|nr:hypothetical protein F5Y10DRAFT_241227 [Nemania abortiva]
MSNTIREPSAGPGQVQPWREWWPPKNVNEMTQSELTAKPWINWKPNPLKPNSKPWLQWVPRDAHLYKNLDDAASHLSQSSGGPRPAPRPGPPTPDPRPPSSNAEGG